MKLGAECVDMLGGVPRWLWRAVGEAWRWVSVCFIQTARW